MVRTPAPADYTSELGATLARLVRQLQEAVEDGTWAASEAASLHAWVRAELIPWTVQKARTLDPTTRRELEPLIAEIAALDAQLLGTVGSAAATMARDLQIAANRLFNVAKQQRMPHSAMFPRQRDNGTSNLPTSPHGSESEPGRE